MPTSSKSSYPFACCLLGAIFLSSIPAAFGSELSSADDCIQATNSADALLLKTHVDETDLVKLADAIDGVRKDCQGGDFSKAGNAIDQITQDIIKASKE